MKKANLTIIACIIAILVFSMIAFQPTTTEASNNVSPTATPSPRKKRVIYPSNVKVKKPVVKSAINGDDDWVRNPKPTQKSRKRKH